MEFVGSGKWTQGIAMVDFAPSEWDIFRTSPAKESAMKASQLLIGVICTAVFLPGAFAQSSNKPAKKSSDKAPESAAVAAPAPAPAKEPLATVDGQPITE